MLSISAPLSVLAQPLSYNGRTLNPPLLLWFSEQVTCDHDTWTYHKRCLKYEEPVNAAATRVNDECVYLQPPWHYVIIATLHTCILVCARRTHCRALIVCSLYTGIKWIILIGGIEMTNVPRECFSVVETGAMGKLLVLASRVRRNRDLKASISLKAAYSKLEH